jgi:hypothetical protein
MKTKLLIMLAAMLLSASAFAQSESTPLKGDVNGDGKVDVADINEIIKIMKEAGGTAEPNTYYWYVGQTDPSTMTSISPIVTDNSSPGWRKIGNNTNAQTLHSKENEGVIRFDDMATYYIAIPKNTLQILSGSIDTTSQTVTYTTTKTIGDVLYYIYTSKAELLNYPYTIKMN